jgi:hypothetical protein
MVQVVHTWNISTHEAKTEGSRVQGHPNTSYTVIARPHLKIKVKRLWVLEASPVNLYPCSAPFLAPYLISQSLTILIWRMG